MKMTRPWTGKKDNLLHQIKKEQHKNRKTKDELEHRWENDDWDIQLQEFLIDANKSIQE